MLKRTKEIIQTTGEKLGVLAPNLPDATTAAQTRREELVAAEGAIEAAQTALEAGHDNGAQPAQLTVLESTLADARLTADRAQRAYKAAEKRLAAAQAADAASAKAGKRAALESAVKQHQQAATKAQQAVEQLAEAVNELDQADAAIHASGCVSKNAPVGLVFGPNVSRRRVELALIAHKVFVGSAPSGLPSLTEWAASVGETALLP